MHRETACDAVMVGRAASRNPEQAAPDAVGKVQAA